MAQKTGNITVVSNPHVPDIFCDDAFAFDHIAGTIRISLGSIKMAEPAAPSPAHLVTVGRLVMTVPGAQRLALALFDYLKKQGLDPAELVAVNEGGVN
jgi:hypothetical protein